MEESNDRKALKSGIWYIVANFAVEGIGFLTMPFFLRLMTKEEVGDYTNFITWVALLLPVLTLSLNTSVTLAKFDFKDKVDDFISSVLVLGSVVTIVCYCICFFFQNKIKEWLGFDTLQFNIMFAYIAVAPALQMLQIKSRLEYKYKLSTFLSLLSAGAFTFVALLAVLLSNNRLNGRILGFYIPTIVLNLIIYICFLHKSRKVKIHYWKYGLAISVPFIFHLLAGSLLSSFDKVMINSIVGDEATALYGVAYSCATIVNILWYSLNQAWAPWAFEQMDKNEPEKLKNASKPYMIMFGLIVILFLLLVPEVMWILGGNTYVEALDVIPPVICGFVFQLVYSFYVNIETYEKKTIFIAIGTIIAAVINIGLNLIFIPMFGYVAAAYTTFAGYVFLFLIHYYFVKRIGQTYWYDSKFNFGFLAFFSVILIAMKLVYRLIIIRYVIIGILFMLFVAFFIKNRKEIINAIKTKSFGKVINLMTEFVCISKKEKNTSE